MLNTLLIKKLGYYSKDHENNKIILQNNGYVEVKTADGMTTLIVGIKNAK